MMQEISKSIENLQKIKDPLKFKAQLGMLEVQIMTEQISAANFGPPDYLEKLKEMEAVVKGMRNKLYGKEEKPEYPTQC